MKSMIGGLSPPTSNLRLSDNAAALVRNELVALGDQVNQINRQRFENGTQARVVSIKAAQLVEQRAAAVDAYARQTGQTTQQLASLSKWQSRFALQAERFGGTTADQSKRVQRLDRKIKDLSTYERFDAEDEARRMLARYRPAE